jgi:hypothetical protein
MKFEQNNFLVNTKCLLIVHKRNISGGEKRKMKAIEIFEVLFISVLHT